jgi:hypothetical protein
MGFGGDRATRYRGGAPRVKAYRYGAAFDGPESARPSSLRMNAYPNAVSRSLS